jgi:HAD superfamily phosphoserine phosphatase-like hydrolase
LTSTKLSLRAQQFVDSVLRLQPKVAAFDCDGTLWSGDAGEAFFRWEMEEGLVSKDVCDWAVARYAEYKAGKVSEEVMCGEMVTMHRGLIEAEMQRAAARFFDIHMHGNIFPEMRELVLKLNAEGCETWAVSSSNEWVIRAGMRHFDIPRTRILAASAALDKTKITDKLLRVPSGDGKRQAIREVAKKTPDAAFGNSRWDLEMLAMAKHAFAVNPNPDLARAAEERVWTVYFPHAQGARESRASVEAAEPA